MPKSVKSFVRSYALNSYPFIPGDISEDGFVARLIFKHVRGKRVLDLGCGPVVPIISTFYSEAEEVVAVDKLQENLDFVKYHSDDLKDVVLRAIKYRQRYLSKKLVNPKIRFVKGDVTKRLRDIGLFDSVLNLGCFGAVDTIEQFQSAVDHAYSYLKKGGTLLMINWVGTSKRPYNFNGKMSAITDKIYLPAMLKAGFKVKEMHLSSAVLADDTKSLGYTKVIWAVAKKI